MEDQFPSHQYSVEFMQMEDDCSCRDIHPEINACDSFSPKAYKEFEENEEGRCRVSPNLFSERRRRSRLNERLRSLRSVVPNVSKLDKASALCDAINYVQHLQKEIKGVEVDIQELQQSDDVASKIQYPATTRDRKITKGHDVQLTELNVSTMGEKTIFNVTAYYREGAQVLAPLVGTFASLKLEIQGANFNCFDEYISGTIITQINSEEAVHPNKLKEMFVKAAGINGFKTSLKMRIA